MDVQDQTKAAAPKADTGHEALIGRVFDGRFKIQSLLGRGGMGAVYRAQQLSMDKAIALKVLSRSLSEDEKQVQRFKQEALTSSQLKHPNTIRVIDYGKSDDGYLYLAMELLEGQELSKIVKMNGAMDPRRAVRIARQVCKSAGEAHQLGLVHRDLKPDNIFLCDFFGEKDFVKVLDFGIAKFMEEVPGQESLTQTGFICGTPLYIAPEQALGRPVSARTDLYSLGAILYEMLSGSPPFRAETPIAIVMRHIHDQPPPMQQFKPDLDLPPELEQLVFRMLQKDPRQRPASAEEVGLVLEDLLASGALAPGAPRRPTGSNLPVAPTPLEPTRVSGPPPMPGSVSETGLPPLPGSQSEPGAAPANASPLTESSPAVPIETGISVSDLEPAPESRKRVGLWIAAAAVVAVGAVGAVLAVSGGGSDGGPTPGDGAKAAMVQNDSPPGRAVEPPDEPEPSVEEKAGAAGTEGEAKAGEGESTDKAEEPETDEAKGDDKADDSKEAKAEEPDEEVAPKPATPPPFQVTIASNPENAEVFAGTTLLGNTPLKVTLTKDQPKVDLTLKLADHEDRALALDYNALRLTGKTSQDVTVSLEKEKRRKTTRRGKRRGGKRGGKSGGKTGPDWGSTW